MPQRYNQKVVKTFVKGLVTEASEMTFPEDASSDELNCELLKNGARRRRKGLVYENNFQESTFSVQTGDFVHKQTWYNVSGLSGVEYLVVQVNNMVYFYDKSFQAVSVGLKSFSINLTTYASANGFDPAEEPIQCSSISGFLVITSAAIDPIRVKYVDTTDTIDVARITIKIRDFDYQYAGSIEPNDYPVLADLGGSRTSEAFITYQYDLYNMGWDSTDNGRGLNAFDYWDSQTSEFPSRNKPWWVGRGGDGNQSYSGFIRIEAGNTLWTNGHYIVDLFNKNRSSISGISGLPTETEVARFRATAPYAGRVWYAGLDSSANGGKVFFSKVVENELDLGKCYQIADPVAEDSAGVVDSDGGYILIPDASNIRALFPMGSILLVLAQNGIWAIGGVDQVFKATEFFVKKVSPFGISTSRSLVDAMGTPIFWDVSGIYMVTMEGNQESVQNISQPIKGYFDAISNVKKTQVQAVFDRLNKRVYWMFPSNTETVAHKFSRILVLDLELQAFYPWEIAPSDDGRYLMGGFFLSGFGTADTDFNLYASADQVTLTNRTITFVARSSNVATVTTSASHGFTAGEIVSVNSSNSSFNGVVTVIAAPTTTTFTYANTGSNLGSTSATGDAGELIITTLESSGITDTDIKFVVKTQNNKLTFATFSNRDFLDWGTEDYSSYAETGYEFMGEATLKKNSPYITTYLRRTEENFVSDGAGGYDADYPSSCYLVVKWDFARDSTRWSDPSQVYRMVNYPVANPNDLTFTYPYDTIVSRTKIRGKGRVLRLKFYSETGKDFYLIGWETVIAANPRF